LVVRHEIEAVSIEEEGLAVAPHAKRTPERLSMFSDAVFAVLITVLVLELRPPALPTFNALLSLWPTWLSYAVSYLFIAIVWANHHHLLHYANEATPGLMWFNFAHLFSVSLLLSPPLGWLSVGWRRSPSPSMRRSSSWSTSLTFV
jgi:TMEM175 potassium channel family protein